MSEAYDILDAQIKETKQIRVGLLRTIIVIIPSGVAIVCQQNRNFILNSY